MYSVGLMCNECKNISNLNIPFKINNSVDNVDIRSLIDLDLDRHELKKKEEKIMSNMGIHTASAEVNIKVDNKFPEPVKDHVIHGNRNILSYPEIEDLFKSNINSLRERIQECNQKIAKLKIEYYGGTDGVREKCKEQISNIESEISKLTYKDIRCLYSGLDIIRTYLHIRETNDVLLTVVAGEDIRNNSLVHVKQDGKAYNVE